MAPQNIQEENPKTLARIVRVAEAMRLPKGIDTVERLALASRIAGRAEVAEMLKIIWPDLLTVRKNPQLSTMLAVILIELEEHFGTISMLPDLPVGGEKCIKPYLAIHGRLEKGSWNRMMWSEL